MGYYVNHATMNMKKKRNRISATLFIGILAAILIVVLLMQSEANAESSEFEIENGVL
jgi:uncharacterized integral membrane protein